MEGILARHRAELNPTVMRCLHREKMILGECDSSYGGLKEGEESGLLRLAGSLQRE